MIVWALAALLVAVAVVLVGASHKRTATAHELDGYHSRFFQLTRIDIPDRTGTVRISFVVPKGWESGLTPSDNFWIADREGSYILQRSTQAEDITEGEEAARNVILDELKEGPPGSTALTKPRIYSAGEHTIFESANDMLYEGDRATLQSLVRIWREANRMYAVGFHLIVRAGLWGRPETNDLIDLFREQLLRADMWLTPSLPDRLPAQASAARYNFRDLAAVQPHGFMNIGVPSHWREHVSDGAYGYYDPEQRSGAVWIAYHVIVRDYDARMQPSREVDRYWRESEDPELERLQWMVKDTTADRSMVALIDLFLDKGQADDPEFQELILILDEQIRRMKIGLPPPDAKATVERGKRRE